ncbi:MAG: hypothetical protein KKB79_03590 [Nanoarchaeota archaeon]|nr:hypothetical protein [Nanoarchaeota archaeon]
MNKSLFYFVVAVVALAVVAVFQFSGIGLTGFSVFEQGDIDGFNMTGSSWVNLSWSGSAIIVEMNQTSGEYISGVFGDGVFVNWDNLTYVGSGDLSFEATACSESDCSDASFASADINEIGLTGEYFQYKILFNTNVSELTSVSIQYSVESTVLVVTINSPLEENSSEVTQMLDISVSGDNLDTIWYNWNGSNVTYASVADIEFGEGSHTLFAWANDTLGNLNSTSVSFIIALPACGVDHLELCGDETSCTDASGYWYNLSCHTSTDPNSENEEEETTTTESPEDDVAVINQIIPEMQESFSSLVLGELNDLKLGSGEVIGFSLTVKNDGEGFMFQCSPSVSGNNSERVSFEEASNNINPAEESIFRGSISVPEDVAEGSYEFGVSVQCSGTSSSKDFTFVVEDKKIEFSVVSVEKINDDEIKITYFLKELSGTEQNVSLGFSLLNAEDESVAEIKDIRLIAANFEGNFEVVVSIDPSKVLGEDASLVVDLNSEIYSGSVIEPVTIGAVIGGFAIFGGFGTGTFVVFIVVLAVLVAAFFIVRKIRTTK